MTVDSRANPRKLAPSEVAARLGSWSEGGGPLYRRLADSIAALVTDGALGDGDRLPPERTLAVTLSVSRGTVVAAYDLLRRSGTVERVQGSGTVVRAPAASYRPSADRVGDALFESRDRSVDLLLAVPRIQPRTLEIVGGVRLDDHRALLDCSDPAGAPELRAAIAAHVSRQGVPTTPEQILVTNGAQQSITLIVGLLTRPGDVVLCEAMTWPGLADVARQHGARVHGISMDRDGIRVDELGSAVERLRPALIGLNPHHHNPTGTRLSPVRRERVAAIAADYGVPLVEDRVAAGLAFDRQVPPPLSIHRPDGVHFVADSLNKIAWPGLRIGWVRADPQAIESLRSGRVLVDLFAPLPSQLMALAVLEHYDEILAERLAELESQADALRTAMARLLPEWELGPIRGGLVSWARLPEGTPSGFADVAARFGVGVAGGREFAAGPTVDQHIRVPFTAPADVLVEGIERLATAWRAFVSDRPIALPGRPAAII